MEQALNKRQQAVLDWVGQGCPDGVWPDSTYKTSGQALQNRGLIKVTKRRGYWSAHLTEKGRQHLIERGIRPVEQSTRPPERPAQEPAPPRPRAVPKALANYADQLLDELAVANDGCLIKPIESGPHAVNWASRVNAARKSGKIPHTQELHGYRTHRGYEIKLVDIPAWRLAELTPLPVFTRLTKPHAVVAALQKQPQPMGLTKPLQGRALRIIQTDPSSPPPQPKATRHRSEPHKARPHPTGAARHHRTSPSPPKAKVSDSSSSKNRTAANTSPQTRNSPTPRSTHGCASPASTTPPPAAYASYSAAAARTVQANGQISPTGLWKNNSPRSCRRSDSAARPQNADALQTSKPERYSKSAGKPPCRKPTPPTPTPTASNSSENRQTPGTRLGA